MHCLPTARQLPASTRGFRRVPLSRVATQNLADFTGLRNAFSRSSRCFKWGSDHRGRPPRQRPRDGSIATDRHAGAAHAMSASPPIATSVRVLVPHAPQEDNLLYIPRLRLACKQPNPILPKEQLKHLFGSAKLIAESYPDQFLCVACRR